MVHDADAAVQGTSVVINGNNFGTTFTPLLQGVTIGGKNCSVKAWSNTQITCKSPVGESPTNLVKVFAAGQSNTNTIYFAYDAPVVSGVSYTPFPGLLTSGGQQVTINGSVLPSPSPLTRHACVFCSKNFGVTWGTVSIVNQCPVVSWTDTQIVCTSPVGMGANLNLQVK